MRRRLPVVLWVVAVACIVPCDGRLCRHSTTPRQSISSPARASPSSSWAPRARGARGHARSRQRHRLDPARSSAPAWRSRRRQARTPRRASRGSTARSRPTSGSRGWAAGSGSRSSTDRRRPCSCSSRMGAWCRGAGAGGLVRRRRRHARHRRLHVRPRADRRRGVPEPGGPQGAAGDFMLDLARITACSRCPRSCSPRSRSRCRFRRSRGVERLQLKWFTYPSAVVGVGLGLSASAGGVVADVGFLVGLLALAALPVAAGVAVLRYRLYDIDLVIRRTLIYGALTATLGATYLGLVLLVGLAVGEVEPRDRGLDARGGRALPPGAGADPGGRRPALLPAPLRRGADARGVRRAAAGRARPRGARRRPAHRGRETVQPAHVSLWLRGER